MRNIIRLTKINFFLILLLMSVSVFGQQTSPEKPKEKTEKPSEKPKEKTEKPSVTSDDLESEELEVEFPEVEKWEKGSIQTYPVAELGFSTDYISEKAGKVTIYVYNAGLKKISSDVSDKRVKEEIEKAKGEIRRVAEMGYYENLKEVKNETINLNGKDGLKSLYALFNFSARGTELTSEIYLFTYKNHFIKIRATRPKASGENADKEVKKLLTAIDSMFSK